MIIPEEDTKTLGKSCGEPLRGTSCDAAGNDSALRTHGHDFSRSMDVTDANAKLASSSKDPSYRKAFLAGYENGKHDGYGMGISEGASRTNRRWKKRAKFVLAIVCAVCVAVCSISASVAYRFGYADGYLEVDDGYAHGNEAATDKENQAGIETNTQQQLISKDVPAEGDYIGTVSADNTITLYGVESAGTYVLRYANEDGALFNYADICSLEVVDPAVPVSCDDLILQNCAPAEATTIAVYNAVDEKVGDIALGGLKINLGSKLYSFGAIADIHVGSSGWYDKVSNAIKDLTRIEKVDFICIPGDLTELASNDNFRALKNTIETYSTPIYVSTGNHDTPSHRKTYDITDDFLMQYTGHPRYYSFTHGNDVFIMFGVQDDLAEGLFSGAQLEWLYETLEANKDKRCFVFQHVFPEEGCGNAAGFYDHDIWGYYCKESFESLMARYSNAIFFHGHSHTTFAGQTIDDMANYDNIRGAHSVHTPSVSKTRALTGEYDTSMSEGYAVDVYENGIVLRGKDFANKKFMPIAQYQLDTTAKAIGNGEVSIPVGIEWEVGMKLDPATGTAAYVEPTESKVYCASQMIAVDHDELQVGWTFGNNTTAPQVLCYDENLQYIGSVKPGDDRSITLLDHTAYVRLRGSFATTTTHTLEKLQYCVWVTKKVTAP